MATPFETTDRPLIERWVLMPLAENEFLHEKQECGGSGSYALGFVYVDHSQGMTLAIQSFCGQENGSIQTTSGPPDVGIHVIVRYNYFIERSLTVLSDGDAAQQRLPSKPDWLKSYHHEHLNELRDLELLHPLRAPGFPDDIKFFIPPRHQADEPELVWGRLENQLDEHVFECILLNQPHQNFGINRRDHVVVSVKKSAEAVMPVCLCLLSELRARMKK